MTATFRSRSLCFLLSAFCLCFVSLPARAQIDWVGKVVRSIEFHPDTAYDTSRLGDVVAVAVGKPLTVQDVQQSIRALFATGDFRDVRVDAEPRDDGVAITFLLTIHYRVGTIAFDGLSTDHDRATRELVIHPDDTLSLDAVDHSATALQRLLARQGWLDATVDPEVRFIRTRNLADVIFHVAMGTRFTISRIDLKGDTGPYSHEELVHSTKLVVGEPYDGQKARDAVSRLTDFFIGKNRRMADVRFLGEERDTASNNAVVVRYHVNAGPVVHVDVDGIPRSEVRRLLPFRGDELYSQDEIDRASGRILRDLQLHGHYFAEVSTTETNGTDERTVTFHVKPGPIERLGKVEFEGASAIKPRQLQGVIETGHPSLFIGMVSALARRPRGVTTEALTRDRDAIEAFYRLDGFNDVKVAKPVVTAHGDTIDVVFPITEGPRTIVSSVSTTGAEEVSSRRFPAFQTRKGGPLNPQAVARDVVALKTFYAQEGFVNVNVSPSIAFSEDHTKAAVTYKVDEGHRYRIGTVSVHGNTFTKSYVPLRKSGLREGEPFSFVKLLDAQKNLYRLGIFQRVDLEPKPAAGSSTDRDVVIQVDEGKALTVAGSVGYSSEDGFRGTASISHRNLFGTGRFIGLDTTISQRVNRYSLTWREPFLIHWDIPTEITAFRQDELRVNEDAKIDSLGTYVETARLIDDIRWSVRYEYRVVECVVQKPDDLCALATGDLPIEGLPKEDQQIRISSITPSFFWDRRDDPLNPTRGFYTGASLEYAFPLFSAKTTFAKGFVQGAWEKPISTRSQVVLSGRLGLIQPLKSSGPGSVVPFAERFTAGGETTNRAFALDQLGIPCDTLIPDPAKLPAGVSPDTPCTELAKRSDVSFIATGGNAMALFNAEIRFPLYGESLRGALFVDAGNVWSRISVVDPAEIRWGIGTGIRYVTPVGPLRLDFGYKLDRKPFEDPWAAFLTLGYAF